MKEAMKKALTEESARSKKMLERIAPSDSGTNLPWWG